MANSDAAQYYIGLMSGTSLDGVDGVIVDNSVKKIIAETYLAYPVALRDSLRQLTQQAQTSLKDLLTLKWPIAFHKQPTFC